MIIGAKSSAFIFKFFDARDSSEIRGGILQQKNSNCTVRIRKSFIHKKNCTKQFKFIINCLTTILTNGSVIFSDNSENCLTSMDVLRQTMI